MRSFAQNVDCVDLLPVTNELDLAGFLFIVEAHKIRPALLAPLNRNSFISDRVFDATKELRIVDVDVNCQQAGSIGMRVTAARA